MNTLFSTMPAAVVSLALWGVPSTLLGSGEPLPPTEFTYVMEQRTGAGASGKVGEALQQCCDGLNRVWLISTKAVDFETTSAFTNCIYKYAYHVTTGQAFDPSTGQATNQASGTASYAENGAPVYSGSITGVDPEVGTPATLVWNPTPNTAYTTEPTAVSDMETSNYSTCTLTAKTGTYSVTNGGGYFLSTYSRVLKVEVEFTTDMAINQASNHAASVLSAEWQPCGQRTASAGYTPWAYEDGASVSVVVARFRIFCPEGQRYEIHYDLCHAQSTNGVRFVTRDPVTLGGEGSGSWKTVDLPLPIGRST